MNPPPNPPVLDGAARAAISTLADISVPAPTPWIPQTWGWAAVAALVLGLTVWLIVRAVRRHRANRYRVEALNDLTALGAQFTTEPGRAAAMAAIAPLVKRVALAAWPRPEVASLTGDAWIDFLRAHAGRDGLPEPAAQFLKDQQYQPPAVDAMSIDDATRVAGQVRRWIKGHHVRP